MSAGHRFVGVAGHPDDDECTHRADGSDETYCGEPEAAHEPEVELDPSGWRRHTLKTHPPYFTDVVSGIKTFDVRRDDRGFMPGDLLVLREFVPDVDGGYFTGRQVTRRVAYLLAGGAGFGVEAGYVVLGLSSP